MTPRPDGIWRFVKPGPTLGDSAFMTFSRVGDGTKKRNLFARQQELSKNLTLARSSKQGTLAEGEDSVQLISLH
jgi:hypothetical protein